MTHRRFAHLNDHEFHQYIQDKRVKRMEAIDRLSPEQRALVHEYGYAVVNNFMAHGIVKPKAIRHLVETVLNEFSPTRGSFSQQGILTEQNP